MESIQSLITSASTRIRNLKEMEFTPEAELAQLELLLAQTLMQYMQAAKEGLLDVPLSSK